MSKARKMGYITNEEYAKTVSPSFLHEEEKIPPGYEQINDNLFARKDNRFLVFNKNAIEDWPPKPSTKINDIKSYSMTGV